MRGQIIPRGANTWQVRVPNGQDTQGTRKYHTKTIHGNKKDAERYLAKVLRDMDTGMFVEPATMSLNAYLGDWMAGVIQQNRKPNTYYTYERTIGLYIRPQLGSRPLNAISTIEVQRLYTALRSKGLSVKTVRLVHSILKNAFGHAVKCRLLQQNPVTFVEAPTGQGKEMKALTLDEARCFLAAAESDPKGLAFTFAIFTGLRPGEYLGLKWEDLDWEEGTVTVSRTLVMRKANDWHFGTPKTRAGRRRIELPQWLLGLLKSHRTRQKAQRLALGDAFVDHGLIFTMPDGRPWCRRNLSATHFKPLLKAAGLPKDFRLYDLRHTCATLLLAAGENTKVVSERMGHASVATTLANYAHVQPGMQRKATERLDALLFRAGTQ